MQPDKISFSRSGRQDFFFKEIKERVLVWTKQNGRYATPLVWMKGGLYTILILTNYIIILTTSHFYVMTISYILLGFFNLLLAFSFAHDAAHQALTPSKKLNNLVYWITFSLQGASAALWKERHIHSHHLFANIYGADADLDDSFLIRLSPDQPCRWFHRYQAFYAPVLYLFYSLVWIFYKDWVTFFKSQIGQKKIAKRSVLAFLELMFTKVLYLVLFIILPVVAGHLSWADYATGFLLMHFLLSWFLIFTFLMSHYVMEVSFSPVNAQGKVENSWIYHQIATCVDFHPNQRWANWIFGGFNTHLAHHWFPDICHIHYPAITQHIQQILKQHQLPYKQVSYGTGIISHIRFLHFMSKTNHCI